MTMITPSYLGDTIEYSSYASNALGALPYGRPAGGREFTSDSSLGPSSSAKIAKVAGKVQCLVSYLSNISPLKPRHQPPL